MNKFKQVLQSRKFYAAVVGLIIVFTGERAGLTSQQVSDAVILLATFIGGVALEGVRKPA